MITVSFDFIGTSVVTGLMLLATVYLIIWDWESFKFVFTNNEEHLKIPLKVMDTKYWSWVGLIMFVILFMAGFLRLNAFTQLLIASVEGLIAFVIFLALKSRILATE